MKVATRPPIIAVKMPATAGYPEAREIPKHNGKAIRKTKNPERISFLTWIINPLRFPLGISVGSDGILMDFASSFVHLKTNPRL
jgi:hypothetical protein